MSSFLKKARHFKPWCDTDVWIKCDGCGKAELVAENQSDRLFVNDFVHENGWRTMKDGNKWINICPVCKMALEEKKRADFIRKMTATGV